MPCRYLSAGHFSKKCNKRKLFANKDNQLNQNSFTL